MNSQFVSVDEAVATAMTLLPENAALNEVLARQWSYMALRNIGPTSHWFDECELYPNDNLILKKPIDMWKAIDIALFTSTGVEVNFVYRGLGKRIHREGDLDLQNIPYVDLSEDNHAFYLGSNGTSVAKAKLKYWQLPIDNDGLPKIPEGQILAIAFFIRWMWSIRQNENQSDRQISEQNYKMERNKARSEGNAPSGIEMEQIGKEWVSLIGAPQFKQY